MQDFFLHSTGGVRAIQDKSLPELNGNRRNTNRVLHDTLNDTYRTAGKANQLWEPNDVLAGTHVGLWKNWGKHKQVNIILISGVEN